MLTTTRPVTRTGAAAHRRATPTRRLSPVHLLVGVVVVLNLVGLVMVLSASSILSLRQYGSPWHYFERQVVWLVIGTLTFVVAARVNPVHWRRFARPAMGACILGLLAVLVPGVGRSAGGASRWLGTTSVQIQPSELAKVGLILFAADILDRRAEPGRARQATGRARGRARQWRYAMMPVIVVFAVVAALVMKQPDMGTTLVLACIVCAMLFCAGIPAKPLAGLFGAGALLAMVLAVAAPYRLRRLTSFTHPMSDASNTGYQSLQGLAGLGHGGLFGTGIGDSVATWGYLPNAQTDFIFAVIGEETGLLGTVGVTALFAAIAVLGIRLACRATTRYDAMLAAGVTAWIVGQAVVNIGAVVGLLPVTGVPLPFVSFGGSALVIAMFGMGMMANVARRQ